MRITIHRGSKEVGGSCIELQSEDSRLVLDVGMPLFGNDREAIDTFELRRMSRDELDDHGILPKVEGLFQDGERPDAILLSHAHLDHTGLLNHTAPEVPVFASRGTSKIMLAGRLFAAQLALPRERFREIRPEVPVAIGAFTVTGFPVDHSTFGCLAYLIESEGCRVLYTGDIRLHGRKPGMAKRLIECVGNLDIDVMLMEGTHFGFPDGNTANEYELEQDIRAAVDNANGLVLASFSPQHFDRLVAFIRTAKATGRTFVADVYTAFIMHLLSNQVSLPMPDPKGFVRVFVPEVLRNKSHGGTKKIIEKFRDAEIDLQEVQSNPSQFLMVFRTSMLSDFGDELPDATTCLYSRWSGYLESPEWAKAKQKLNDCGGNLKEVHTSGHILSSDIEPFVKAIRPKTVIPIHTFEPATFREHFENALLLEDGEPFEVPC